jgi:NADPH:quinone reductase-like Zn-dependent oxidoreductase
MSDVATRAIRVLAVAGSEVLAWEEVDIGAPGSGEVRIRHPAIGLNFVGIHARSGRYPVPPPSGLGSKAATAIVRSRSSEPSKRWAALNRPQAGRSRHSSP